MSLSKISKIFEQGLDFGSTRSRSNIFSFTIKILFYIIPAIILGHYTDTMVVNFKYDKTIGSSLIYYILLQTFIIISTLYLLIKYFNDYMSEFQSTISGIYFVVLYFGIQINYIHMLNEYMKI